MRWRRLCLGVTVACALSTLAGCELMERFSRRSRSDSVIGKAATSKEESDSSSAASTNPGFFKPTRLPGALSSEGAEIERHLGVQ